MTTKFSIMTYASGGENFKEHDDQRAWAHWADDGG